MSKATPIGVTRVSVAYAKSRLSSLLRTVERQPVVIQNRGRDVARLVASGPSTGEEAPTPFVDFFNRLGRLRQRLGVTGVDFRPAKAVIRPSSPFEDET